MKQRSNHFFRPVRITLGVLVVLGFAAGLLPFGMGVHVEASASRQVNSYMDNYSGRRLAAPEQAEELYYRPGMTASTFSLTAAGNVADLGEAIEFSISGELSDDILSGKLTSRKSPLYFRRSTQNDSYNYDSEFIGVRQSGSQAACGGNPDSLCGVWDINFTYGMEFGDEYGFVGTMNLNQQGNQVSGTMNYNLTPETEAKIGGDDPQNAEYIVSLHSQLELDVSGTFVSSNPPVSQTACAPTVRGISPSKPGDVISPGASYTDAGGNAVGIIQERWYIDGVETSSEVWDGGPVTVELQYTCLDNSGDSRTYEIPAYLAPREQPPAMPGEFSPQDMAKVAGAILIGLAGILGIGGAIGAGAAVAGGSLPGAAGAAAAVPPPEAPVPGASPSFVDSPIWDLVKVNTSAASTIMGTVSDLIKHPDSADSIRKMKDALDVWKNNPTKGNADDYLKTLDNSFGGRNPGFKKMADYLGKAAQIVDILDAVGTGLKKAGEKGFTGIDHKLAVIGAVGTEVIKKGVTWTITKNPVIGLADGVVGGVTQAVWGKDNRIDVGAGVDKVAGGVFGVYDKTTSGLGSMWEKGVTETARSTKNIALDNARQHINGQVARGKISPSSGRARLSRLEKMITGDK